MQKRTSSHGQDYHKMQSVILHCKQKGFFHFAWCGYEVLYGPIFCVAI
jgi:hypothetical protein